VPEKPAFRDAFRKKRCLIPATGFYEWLHSNVAQSVIDDIEREGPSLAKRGQGGLFDDFEPVTSAAPDSAQVTTKKHPFYFTLGDGEPFAFAGLWDQWRDPSGNEIHTCTVLTTTPNEIVAELHDRMPVILKPEDFDHWLDPAVTNTAELMPLMAPLPAEEMRMYPVSTTVNNPRSEGPECVLPL
jgi:putative SOS response-associated peptidase YedK